MCALIEDGVGKTDTIKGWPGSAHTLRDEARSAWVTSSEAKVEGVAGVAKRNANGLQATLIDWREIYRACSTLLG